MWPLPWSFGDPVRDEAGIAADAPEEGRRARVEERHADDVQAADPTDDPPHLDRPAVRPGDPRPDPVVVGSEPGAPDDVRGLDDPAVVQHRPAVSGPDRASDGPLHPGGGEVARPDALERSAAVDDRGPRPASDGRAGDEHVVDEQPEQRIEEAGGPSTGAHRHLAGVPSGQDGRVRADRGHRDLRPRVAGPDDEDDAVAQLRRVAVLARVELSDLGAQLGRERGHLRRSEGAGRQDDLGCAPALIARPHVPADARCVLRQRIDLHARPDGELEPGGVGLEVGGHLVLGRQAVPRTREGHARQAIEARRREQPEPVPAVSPRRPDPVGRLQDQVRPALAGQVMTHREPGLPAADDDGVDGLGMRIARHGGNLVHRRRPGCRSPGTTLGRTTSVRIDRTMQSTREPHGSSYADVTRWWA